MQWMAWTLPTAIFFSLVVLMLAGMTVAQILYPTVERRGFLPIKTTRGDRLFIGLLTSAYIHIFWIAFTDLNLWWATGISLLWLIVVMRWG